VAQPLDDLLARIRVLEEEIEAEYRKVREEFALRRSELAAEFLSQQRSCKIGLFRFLARSRLPVLLSAPVIYLGWIPFLLIDLFASVYQAVCLPITSCSIRQICPT